MRSLLALFTLAAAASGCGGARPPAELAGLWSAGPAACAAGVGVRFGADTISAIYDRQRETLFDRPEYEVQANGARFRVRIEYRLPHHPGGVSVVGARGVLVLARGADGALRPLTHNLADARTGSVRMRIVGDPAMEAMALQPCGAHPWREELRGREHL